MKKNKIKKERGWTPLTDGGASPETKEENLI
jgi:hypothetical protein